MLRIVQIMSFQVGFVLLTHGNPPQILRLVDTLNRMFHQPAIVCHHDFSKCELPLAEFSPNLSFVRPATSTAWGRFSIVEATLRGVAELFARPNPPDWFVLLSAADHPIKPARSILDELGTSPFDAHVEHHALSYASQRDANERQYFRRYCTYRTHLPGFGPDSPRGLRMHSITQPWLTRFLTPFSGAFRCYRGSQWFSANARAAEALLRHHRDHPELARHYLRQERYRLICPDESYIQTILANAPELRVSSDNLRLADWGQGGAHPRTLTVADFPALVQTGAHFARKFDPTVDAGILDLLDRHIGIA